MYCECGCGQVTSILDHNIATKGYKKGDHRKFICGHHSRDLTPLYIEDKNGCWIWQRATNEWGYGVWTIPPQWRAGYRPSILAHRIFFWLEYGYMPEEDLDHTCQVRRCVNPDHLVPCDKRLNQIYMHVSNLLSARGVEADPLKIRSRVNRMLERLPLDHHRG